MILGLILAAVISLANYLSEKISITCSKYRGEIVSTIAGISVAYIFLHLLPELYTATTILNRSLFVFILIGFGGFHVIEKFIYFHVRKNKISEDLKFNHAFALFIYDFSVGIVLIELLKSGFLGGILFFIPVFAHTALSNLELHRVHGLHRHEKEVFEAKRSRIVLAGGAILGALVALIFPISQKVSFLLTGLVTGILLYIVIRETLPKDKEGNPLAFIAGVIIYSILILLVWIFSGIY